jgi:hypothetical protein
VAPSLLLGISSLATKLAFRPRERNASLGEFCVSGNCSVPAFFEDFVPTGRLGAGVAKKALEGALDAPLDERDLETTFLAPVIRFLIIKL